jgi:prolyl-tRNA synthetase
LSAEGKLEYVYASSWGVSTRLIGALIMAHSDDSGLILPPKLAPIHVVIVPIHKSDEEKARVLAEARTTMAELKAQGLAVKLDDREGISPGAKYYEWEGKGVPLRIEVGPKDLEKGTLCLVRRFVLEQPGEDDKARRKRAKSFLPRAEAIASVKPLMETMQKELLERARAFREKRTRVIDDLAAFEKFFKEEGGGFAWVHWAGDAAQEEELAKRFETSIRCLPLPEDIPAAAQGAGKCILTGKPSAQRVVMSKAY